MGPGHGYPCAMRWGYTCSSEEFEASDLVRHAAMAEEVGFDFVSVSDHFHPWTRSQGHSPFVWSTVGGIAAVTHRVRIGTGVTCPLIRTHPAIIAQAAATSSELSGGRFFLGVGTGEALNEHITGDRWPPIDLRREMLVEALDIIRRLWTGKTVDHHGEFYAVENARLFSAPASPPSIIAAAGGEHAARLAAEHADGLWATSPSSDTVDAYHDAGGEGDVIGQLTICWGMDRDRAIDTAYEIWPNAGVPGQLSQDLPTWTHFEQASQLVTRDQIAQQIVCGDDVGAVVKAVQEYVDAGFTSLHLHQVGPDQRGFLAWWQDDLAAALTGIGD
jgi:coenzyme F420-dependent glucose-6-phosphate dehydrogenase